jgi:hypothetical protein
MEKIKIRIDDPKTREIWNAALRAKAEVESWPAWKRGEDTPPPPSPPQPREDTSG